MEAKEAEDKHISYAHSQSHIKLIKTISSKEFDSRRHKIARRFNSIYFNKGSSESAWLAAGSAIEVIFLKLAFFCLSFCVYIFFSFWVYQCIRRGSFSWSLICLDRCSELSWTQLEKEKWLIKTVTLIKLVLIQDQTSKIVNQLIWKLRGLQLHHTLLVQETTIMSWYCCWYFDCYF